MSQEADLNKVRKTESSNNKMQHAMGCESIHIFVDDGQLRIYRTAGVRRELCDQFITSCNGKSQWSTKAFVYTVREIEHHDVVSSGIFTDEYCDKHPWEWTKQAVKTLEEATELYMIEVIPRSHCRSSK